MGCDIHAYLEFIPTSDRPDPYVESVCRYDLGRDYEMFYLMAGVRYEPERMGDLKPVAEPKGVPDNLGWSAKHDYQLHVSPDDSEQAEWEGHCTLKNAKSWVEDGSSKVIKGTTEVPEIISHPDWHSASWLTSAELEEVGRRYRTIVSAESSWFQSADQAIPEGARAIPAQTGWMAKRGLVFVEVGERTPRQPYIGFDALIAMMKVFDTVGTARLVIWFDN